MVFIMWEKIKRVYHPKFSSGKNLHKSFRFLLVIAQLFGFFPIQCVLSEKISSLYFTWISLRVLSSCFTSLCGVLILLGHIRYMALLGFDQFELNGVVFYGCGAISCALFIYMSREWPIIVRKWKEVDGYMSSYGWPKTMDKRVKLVSCIFLLLEAAEHISIQLNKILVAVNCKGSLLKGFEHFSVNMSFPHIFNTISYSPWIGLVLQMINTRMAFSWTFLDLFIVLISIALSLRFQQITKRVEYFILNQVKSERSWETVSADYGRLCRLCTFLDEKMSWLILLSFFNNFYFIIFQVYDSLNLHKATTLETVYFFISLFLLILRIVSICLYGSWVHEESKSSLNLLTSTTISNKEIKRFMDLIKYQDIGFTGKKTFRITRSLIFKIATSVVAYELVVIQISKNSESQDEPSKNSIC